LNELEMAIQLVVFGTTLF